MRSVRRWVIRIVPGFLCLACCASLASSQEWTRARSPHFVVFTDAGEKRGKELAVRFEEMRRVFEKLLSTGNLTSPIPLQILAFRNTKSFERVVYSKNGNLPQHVAGVFLAGPDMDFIALDLVGDEFPVVCHEYSHSVLRANFRRVPLWFNEGLAVYYQTIRIDKSHVEIGRSPKYADTVLAGRALIPVAKLFSTTKYTENDVAEAVFYNESWLVVHYLFDKGMMGKFAKYMDLASTQSVPVPTAIEQAFGMTPKKLDDDIAAYLNFAQRQIFTIDDSVAVEKDQITAEPIDEDESTALIANMQLHTSELHNVAIDGYKAVLAKNPNHVDANLGLGYDAFMSKKEDEAENYIRKALAADPKNARAHYLLGAIQVRRDSTPENRQERMLEAWNNLKAAASLSPELAEAHSLLAKVLQDMGAMDEAIKEATTAARLNQGSEEYFMNLGELYFASKRYDKAKPIFQELASSSSPITAALANTRLQALGKLNQTQPQVPSNP